MIEDMIGDFAPEIRSFILNMTKVKRKCTFSYERGVTSYVLKSKSSNRSLKFYFDEQTFFPMNL